MLHSLQQQHLIIYHLFIAFDVLLENNLDGIFLSTALSFTDDSIGTSTQSSPEFILGSAPLSECFPEAGIDTTNFLS